MQLPQSITIIEVGPRDGFQNQKAFIPTEKKIEVIKKMIDAGVQEMELTSFVNPKVVPQMSDAAEVAAAVLGMATDCSPIALAPNARGAENAYAAGLRRISYVISASEAHNMANVHRSKKESFAELDGVIAKYPDLHVRLDIATGFGCPYQGTVPADDVLWMIRRALDGGVEEIVLCDTVGIATPAQVRDLVGKAKSTVSNVPLTLHMHDTRGMGLANMLAAAQSGIVRFETSVGGLGGCPFAPGATGNSATEDTVYMFQSMGVGAGIDLEAYIRAAEIVQRDIEPLLTGHLIYTHGAACCAG